MLIRELEYARPTLATAMVLVALAAAAPAAGAQTKADAQAASVVAPQLKEVVVTAQRRAEPIQDVPITINYLSAQQLTRSGATSLSDIAALTPGMVNYYQSAFWQPTIRGVGSLLITNGSASNVGVYIDGFYSPNLETSDIQLLNVQSIQVLEGPQGTLFGRNTTGGAILVDTSPPSTTTNLMANVDWSSYNTQKYQTYFTTGITHDLAVDVAGMFSQSDGWIHNIAADNRDAGAYRDYSVRLGLLYTPTDDLSFLLHYYHSGSSDPTDLLYTAYEKDGVPQSYGRFIPGAVITTSPYETAYPADQPVDFKLHTNVFQLTTKYDFGVGTLTSYTQYRKEYGEQFVQEGFDSIPTEYLDITESDPRTFSQELLANSKPGTRLQWTAGAFVFDYRDLWPTYGSIFGVPTSLLAGSASTNREFAGYFNLTYQLAPKWFLTGGFRYTHDEFSEGDYYSAGFPVYHYPTLTNNHGTPRAVLRYQIDPQSSVYASFSTGFKAAIYNVAATFTGPPIPVRPETLKAYEIGYKLATPRVSGNLSAYFYDYSDLQVESYETVNGVPEALTTNAARSRIWGLDGGLDFRIIPSLQVNLSAAYTHAIYVNYTAAPTYPECLSASCGTSYGLYLDSSTNASDFDMPNAPRFTGTIAPVYTISAPGGSSVALSATYYYTSSYYFDSAEEFKQHPYSTLGVRAEWTSASGHWSAALYGNNVTDTHYLIQVLPGTFGIGAVWAEPTSVGVSLSYRLH